MYCKYCNVFVKYYKQNATKINKIQKKDNKNIKIALLRHFRTAHAKTKHVCFDKSFY